MKKNYRVEVRKPALKFIAKQPPVQQQRIIAAIYALPDGDTKPMEGGEPNRYRLRVGDYRIIYLKYDDRLVIIVVRAGNRGDVYKG